MTVNGFTPFNLAATRPLVAISRCLIGEPVRYDGGHQAIDQWQQRLARPFQLLPICPEVAAGLGTPRPAVQLVLHSGQYHAQGREQRDLDVTAALEQSARNSIRKLSEHNVAGYIFKSRSPSCGFGSTPLYNSEGDETGLGDGIQAAAIHAALPYLCCIEETELTDEKLAQFIRDSQQVTDVIISMRQGTLASLQAFYRQQHALHRSKLEELIEQIYCSGKEND